MNIFKSTFFLLLVFAVNNMLAQGIVFSSLTFEKALEQAESENKSVFIDCYTSWCGPCKMLARDVFTLDEVGVFFNSHFVCLKLDMEREGKPLAKPFGVDKYPTLLFIHPESKEVVHKVIGAQSGGGWLIEEARKALDPKRNLPGLALAYERDRHNAETALNYFNALDAAGMTQQKDKQICEYLQSLTDDERYTVENWNIVAGQSKSLYSHPFEFLLMYADGYRKSVGAETVDQKIDLVYRMEILPFIRRKRIPADEFPNESFCKLREKLTLYNGKNIPFYRAQMEMVASVQRGDYAAMLRNLNQAEKQKIWPTDKFSRFHFIWLNMTYLSECCDKKYLKQGMKWMEKIKPINDNEKELRLWQNLKDRLTKAIEGIESN